MPNRKAQCQLARGRRSPCSDGQRAYNSSVGLQAQCNRVIKSPIYEKGAAANKYKNINLTIKSNETALQDLYLDPPEKKFTFSEMSGSMTEKSTLLPQNLSSQLNDISKRCGQTVQQCKMISTEAGGSYIRADLDKARQPLINVTSCKQSITRMLELTFSPQLVKDKIENLQTSADDKTKYSHLSNVETTGQLKQSYYLEKYLEEQCQVSGFYHESDYNRSKCLQKSLLGITRECKQTENDKHCPQNTSMMTQLSSARNPHSINHSLTVPIRTDQSLHKDRQSKITLKTRIGISKRVKDNYYETHLKSGLNSPAKENSVPQGNALCGKADKKKVPRCEQNQSPDEMHMVGGNTLSVVKSNMHRKLKRREHGSKESKTRSEEDQRRADCKSQWNRVRSDSKKNNTRSEEDERRADCKSQWDRVRSKQAHVFKKPYNVEVVSRRPKSVLVVSLERLAVGARQYADRNKGEPCSALTPGQPDLLSQRQMDYLVSVWRRLMRTGALDRFVTVLRPLTESQRRQLMMVLDEEGGGMLLMCCQAGGVQLLPFLLQHCGAQLEHRRVVWLSQTLYTTVRLQVTPLWAAADSGHLPVITMLLRYGAKVNARATGGSTPLHAACARGHVAVVEALLESGADVTSTDDNGTTALMAAVHSAELVNVLLRHSSMAGQADCEGNTALHYAASYGSMASVRALLQFGASSGRANKEGRTPLHSAALRGWQHIVLYLLDASHHTLHQVIEAYELLGCGLVLLREDAAGIEHWRKALTLQQGNMPLGGLGQLTAFGLRGELSSVEELEAVSQDRDALWQQALLLKQRICGLRSREFAMTALQLVDCKFKDGQYDQSLQLMTQVFHLHLQLHHPLSPDLAYTVHQMVSLALKLHNKQIENDQLQKSVETFSKATLHITLSSLVEILNTMVQHLGKAQTAIKVHQLFKEKRENTESQYKSRSHAASTTCSCSTCLSVSECRTDRLTSLVFPCQCYRHAYEKLNQPYLLILSLALYLVRHLAEHTGQNNCSPQTKYDFRRVVYRLVKGDHRSQHGDSVLHLCFPLCQMAIADGVEKGLQWHRAPTLAMLDTLLTSGAHADAVNHAGESPLIQLLCPNSREARLVLGKHSQREAWVGLLLQHGAHVDRKAGTQRRDLLTALRRLDHLLHQHVNLQCLAARVIRQHALPYDHPSLLPSHLIHFVHFH